MKSVREKLLYVVKILIFSAVVTLPIILPYFKIIHGLFDKEGKKELITHPSFKMSLVNLGAGQSIDLALPSQERLISLMNLFL